MTWGVPRKGIGRLFSAHSMHTGAVPTSNQREEGELQTERMTFQSSTWTSANLSSCKIAWGNDRYPVLRAGNYLTTSSLGQGWI